MADEEIAPVLLTEADVDRLRPPGQITYIARTDAVKAAEIREQLGPLLDQACNIMHRARADGLIVNFSLGLDMYGRNRVNELTIVRPL